MLNQNRDSIRQMFFQAWKKHQQQQHLNNLEKQIVDVILQHPEYHFIFNQSEKYLTKDFFPELGETNPFLHLSLHLSIQEQINTNRPAGIKEIFTLLCKNKPTHDAEHLMIDCLAEMLWQAQRAQQMPDESIYLAKLKALLN